MERNGVMSRAQLKEFGSAVVVLVLALGIGVTIFSQVIPA
jgi:hypothetical protein